MKWIAGGRLVLSAAGAVMLVIFALWLWTHAATLSTAIAPSSASGMTSGMTSGMAAPRQLTDAVYCVAIAMAAGAQALLIREVVPAFYRIHAGDDLVHLMCCAVAAGGLISAVLLLVVTS